MTDTDKWKKQFIKSLPAEYKLFWFYILDDCDHAGVWHIDMEIAEMRLGIRLSLEKARGFFSGKVVEFDNRTKWFILDFIGFQYGDLKETNKMYKPVTSILKKYNLMGHLSPINGGKDKVKEKEEDKVMDKEQDFGKSENLLLVPAMFDVFKKNNPSYLGSIELDYKPLYKIATFFCDVGKLTGSPDRHKDKILEVWETVTKVIKSDNFYKQKTLSTISNQIQEITQIAINGKATSKNGKQNYGTPERANEYDRLFAERYGSRGSTVG